MSPPKHPNHLSLPEQLQLDSGDIILFSRRCLAKSFDDALSCSATRLFHPTNWDHVGILLKNENGEYEIAEFTSQGLLVQKFEDRILYSRSHEIAVRKLCLANSQVKKMIPAIVTEWKNSKLTYKSSILSALSISKERQNNQLKLLNKRKRLEEVEFDLEHSRVSEFQRRSLDAERIQILQSISKLQSLLEMNKDHDVPISSISEIASYKPMSSVEFIIKLYRAIGLLQDEIDDPHASLFSSKNGISLLKGADLGHEIFIRSPSLKLDEEHLTPHQLQSTENLPQPKLEKDTSLIDSIISKSSLFSTLDKKERHELISKFRLHRFSPGEIITAEGAFNDALYVVEEGDVDIWITRGLSKKRFAGVLGAGQSFGRLDLSHPAGEPVFASLKAKSNASVWILSGPVFHEYIEALSFNSSKNSSKKANAEQLKKILKAQSLFQNIADDKFDFLAQKAFKMTVNPGEAVVRQGSVGDYFYVIQDGEFEVYNTRPGKLPKLVDNLRAGHSFGSWSLLYDTPRAATVKSKSKGIVWAIDRHTFRQVIGPGPSYMQEAFDKNASVEVNGQKFMTSDDLFKAIRSSQKSLLEKNVPEFKSLMFRCVDRSDSKLISFPDLLLFDEIMSKEEPELKLAFSFFDIDKDGYIGIEDLKALYSANNVDSLMQLDSKEVSQIFNSNKNGITFPLFQSILRHSHSLDISSDVALKLRFAFRSIDQFNFISDIWRNSLIGSLEGAETRPKEKSSRIDWNMVKSLFSGAVAGAVSRTVTSPLERLKVIKQIQMGDKYKGVIAPLIQMYKEEGIRSYWKGNGTNVARIAPYSAIQFFTFDVYKEMLSDNRENPGTLNVLTAGGLAGMTSTIFCYPLDLVRSILTVQTSNAEYKGMNDALVKIYRTQGFFGLYKGLGTTLMGIAPYIAVNFATFDTLKRKFLPNKDHPYFDLMNLGLGAVSGACAVTVTYPSDVLRRRMQLSGMSGLEIPTYNGTLDCIQKVYKQEGIKGFYKGLVPCYLKVVPSMAIAFMTFERLKKLLKFEGGKPQT